MVFKLKNRDCVIFILTVFLNNTDQQNRKKHSLALPNCVHTAATRVFCVPNGIASVFKVRVKYCHEEIKLKYRLVYQLKTELFHSIERYFTKATRQQNLLIPAFFQVSVDFREYPCCNFKTQLHQL